MSDLIKLIQTLKGNRFWGKIEIDFKDGKPKIVTKSETFVLN